MWRPFEFVRGQLAQFRLRRSVRRALALHRRGEARADGLSLLRFHSRLEIRWRSRTIHPWDAGLSAERRAALRMRLRQLGVAFHTADPSPGVTGLSK